MSSINGVLISVILTDVDSLRDFLFSSASGAAVPRALDMLWTVAMEGTLYSLICRLGLLIAVFGIGFWCLKFYKSLEEGSLRPVVNDIIWPLLLVILLSNNGANMRSLTMVTRDMMNSINRSVDTVVSAEISLQNVLRVLATSDWFTEVVNREIRVCQENTDIAAYSGCMGSVKVFADNFLNNNANWPSSASAQMQKSTEEFRQYQRDRTKNTLSTEKIQSIKDAQEGADGKKISNVIDITKISGFDDTSELRRVILGFRGSFLYIIEVMMLVTGMFGPIFLAISIFPVGTKPITSWGISFVSLGFCKICFTLISGLSALAMVFAGPKSTDMVVASIVLGLLSPILAFGVASGSGIAALNSVALVGQGFGLNPGVSYGSAPSPEDPSKKNNNPNTVTPP
jgi:hypothetical protein